MAIFCIYRLGSEPLEGDSVQALRRDADESIMNCALREQLSRILLFTEQDRVKYPVVRVPRSIRPHHMANLKVTFVYSGVNDAVRSAPGAIHAFAVHRQADIAFTIDGNQPTFAAD